MQNDRYFDGKYVTAVGWGSQSFAGPGSTVLKKAFLQVLNSQTCSKQSQFVTNSKFCTSESPSGSTCTQDSGGGLYYSAGRRYVIGIVSYGRACASPTDPSVNTRITSFIGFIESNVKEFMCRKT